jgi:hypothetical protein
VRDDRPITGQGEARRGDGREELLLRRGPLALLHTVDVQRDVHGARDRRRRAALAGLDLRGVADVENDWIVQAREDLGVRDGVVRGEADRTQAPRAAWLRREGGEGADDTHCVVLMCHERFRDVDACTVASEAAHTLQSQWLAALELSKLVQLHEWRVYVTHRSYEQLWGTIGTATLS